MAFITKEERQQFYDTYPPGTKVLVLQRHTFVPGTVTARYGRHGTIYIEVKLDSGLMVTILYGNRSSLRFPLLKAASEWTREELASARADMEQRIKEAAAKKFGGSPDDYIVK